MPAQLAEGVAQRHGSPRPLPVWSMNLAWGHTAMGQHEEAIRILKGITEKPKNVEIILTGRDAPKEIIKIADLVTEMKEIKHYFKKNIKARKGIEF